MNQSEGWHTRVQGRRVWIVYIFCLLPFTYFWYLAPTIEGSFLVEMAGQQTGLNGNKIGLNDMAKS